MSDRSETDTFLTLAQATYEEIYKDKGSKFLAYAYPIEHADEVDQFLQEQRKAHPKARHWCYAWQIGVENPRYRYNDDGEPGSSAGKPIYGQIQSFGLTNVLVIVVRYFGGTKLGVGGLINAYRSAARLAFENASIIEKVLLEELTLEFEYAEMDKVMRIIKENKLAIEEQKMELNCFFRIAVPKSKIDQVFNAFVDLRSLKVKKLN